ncbi:MAG: SDR family oxidoreductase [Chloroflexi bacterium]|nr:SDR family oxidoreductase [Chloroflexota bacterium]
MPRPINEQVVVITGASSGIGRQTALKLGQLGASVVLAARNGEALVEVADEIRRSGGQALVVPTDVSDWNQVQQLAQQAISTFGRVDTWINDAATSVYATVEDTTLQEYEQLIQVNYLGTVYGVKAILPHMKQQGGGTIINLGSVESQRALPYHSAYSATKHAVKGFTEALRMEQEREKSGVNITLIMPAGINTPFFNHSRSKIGAQPQPAPPAYPPELVADAIIYAAQHKVRDIYVGGASWLFTLMERISPKLTDKLMTMGGMMFRLQKANRPDDQVDNLYQPMTGPGRVHGDYAHLTKPSLYTRLFELTPTLPRLVMMGLGALIGMTLLRRRNEKPELTERIKPHRLRRKLEEVLPLP